MRTLANHYSFLLAYTKPLLHVLVFPYSTACPLLDYSKLYSALHVVRLIFVSMFTFCNLPLLNCGHIYFSIHSYGAHLLYFSASFTNYNCQTVLILAQVCCICLTKYGDDDELRELPCNHLFHVQCVDKWLKINAVCPLCKTEIGGVVRSFFGLPFGRRRVDRMAGRGVASSRFSV
jgi:hypothetical protein